MCEFIKLNFLKQSHFLFFLVFFLMHGKADASMVEESAPLEVGQTTFVKMVAGNPVIEGPEAGIVEGNMEWNSGTLTLTFQDLNLDGPFSIDLTGGISLLGKISCNSMVHILGMHGPSEPTFTVPTLELDNILTIIPAPST